MQKKGNQSRMEREGASTRRGYVHIQRSRRLSQYRPFSPMNEVGSWAKNRRHTLACSPNSVPAQSRHHTMYKPGGLNPVSANLNSEHAQARLFLWMCAPDNDVERQAGSYMSRTAERHFMLYVSGMGAADVYLPFCSLPLGKLKTPSPGAGLPCLNAPL